MNRRRINYVLLLTLFFITNFATTVSAEHYWPSMPNAMARKNGYNLGSSKLLLKTLQYIEKNYVEPERIDPREMFKGSMDALQKGIPEIVVTYDSATSVTVSIDNAAKKFSATLKDINSLWQLMQEILAFIEINYQGEIKLDDIEAVVINGILETLDPHSNFLTPNYYKEFKIDTGGHFGGLGIVISSKDGDLSVITPIEDTPAWQAGIEPGDVITQIDTESTINMPLTKAVEKLRGKIGSKVAITIKRKGRPAPFKLTMTRANINIDSVKSSSITDSQGTVAYIKLKKFQKDTYKDFTDDLKEIKSKAGSNFRGLILDLRNNPGGLLDQAIKIADAFIADGVIVSTVGANKRFIEEDKAHLLETESKYPLVVLVNQGSASASEIVAGALQAHKRALLIGEQTFGKGSVQSVYELGDLYALKLTIAQYLTAGEYSIQTVGISSDIPISPATIAKDFIDIVPNETASEKELTKHLKQLKPITASDQKILLFYQPYIKEDEIEDLRRKEYSSKIDLTDDFAVKLASRIIFASTSANPAKMLKDAEIEMGKLEAQEQEKIIAKLGEVKTNWSQGPAVKKPDFTVSTVAMQGGKVVDRAKAGEMTDIVMTVVNSGKTPIYRLTGVVDTKNSLLDEKEFIFGKVSPGQSASFRLSLELPNGLQDINIPYTVKFQQDDVLSDKTFETKLKVEALKRPKFSINYQLGKPAGVEARHPLPRGKIVPLTVKIKNIGDGPTKEASAYIGNKEFKESIFIEKGRVELGVIKPGETKVANFAFKVQPDIKSSSFVLELSAGDRELMEFLVQDLTLTIESGEVKPSPGVWYEGPQIRIAENRFPVSVKEGKYHLEGKITDKNPIKDYYIFVDENKVVYKSNPEETDTMPIDNVFNIKEGNNQITIVARDQDKLSSIRSFIIER